MTSKKTNKNNKKTKRVIVHTHEHMTIQVIHKYEA